jgi:hypothetical protein
MSDGVSVRSGIHPLLEAEANALIFGSLRGVTSQREKSDILTPWKEADRRSREVLSTTGSIDPMIRRGMYHRARNLSQGHLNSRDGVAGLGVTRGRAIQDDWPNFNADGASEL